MRRLVSNREEKRGMEGQAKEVFRAWMSRQPYTNVTVCVQKLSCQSSSPSASRHDWYITPQYDEAGMARKSKGAVVWRM